MSEFIFSLWSEYNPFQRQLLSYILYMASIVQISIKYEVISMGIHIDTSLFLILIQFIPVIPFSLIFYIAMFMVINIIIIVG